MTTSDTRSTDNAPAVFAAPLLVLAGAILLAAAGYLQFLEIARFRWDSVIHDRNAHYLLGLSLALDVRHLDLRQLLSDLDGARTWPPLHGVLEGLVLSVGGTEYRLAVLPSLAGWVGTIFLGFLLARRLAPVGGNLAGLTAAVFIASSPAHHAFATDTMLESLGACLSLLALYLYVRAVQDAAGWRALGLVLTLLFLQKFNYWLLVVLALAAAEFSLQPWQYVHLLLEFVRSLDWRRWLWSQLLHPLNYVLAIILGLLAVVIFHGGTEFHLGSMRVSLHSPHNLLHLAYALVLVRLLVWGWRQGRQIAPSPLVGELRSPPLPPVVRGERAGVRGDRIPRENPVFLARMLPPLTPNPSPPSTGARGDTTGNGDRVRELILWHAVPIALWFLLPKRLGYWLLYMNPPTNAGEVPQHSVTEGALYYWQSLVRDYHLGLWSALLAVGLCVLALLWQGRLRPGGRAVLLFVLIALALTIPHPNRKSRFLHTWVVAGWVASGVGLAVLLRGRAGEGRLRPWLAAAALGGLACAHSPAWLAAGHSPERGHCSLTGSTRDLSDYYLPFVARSQRTAFLSTVEMKHVIRWSVLESLGRRDRIETDIKGFGASPEEDRRCFADWLHTTRCDTIVFIDIPAGSHFYEPASHNLAFGRLRELLKDQTLFQVVERREFPVYGCSVSVWERGHAEGR